MTTSRFGHLVAATLAAGHVSALVLVIGPLAGANEPVTTGTVLLAFAAGWAMLRLPVFWFMAVAGTALVVVQPGDSTMGALAWVWPPAWIAVVIRTAMLVRRDLHGRSSWVALTLLAAYMVAGLGGAYQVMGESIDRRASAAPGQLIDVGGHLLHLSCSGTGTPTVVLEAGLGETGASWGWISQGIAADTRVCAYDRAGRGWSDAAGRQDAVAVATDLHTLLMAGNVPPPYVLVGHSTGAQYVRVFAGRYPEEVAGMVLLDGQPAEAFEGLPDYPAFYGRFRRVSGVLPSLARLGAGRLLSLSASTSVPASALAEQHRHYALPRHYSSLRDEFAALPASLQQARSFQNLGDRPLVVVTASQAALRGWLPLQRELATLSRNSRHRIVSFTHDEVVSDQDGAQASIQAIRDVVHAVRFSAPLK